MKITVFFLILLIGLSGCGSHSGRFWGAREEDAHTQSVQQLESVTILEQFSRRLGRGRSTVRFTWEPIDDGPYGHYTIYFDYDDDKVRLHQKQAFEKVVTYANEAIERGETIIVEGHAGLHGKKQWYNQRIAKRRAQAVARALVKCGIEKNRIKIFSRGQEMPAAFDQERTPDRQGYNRRVEVYGIAD